MSAFSAPPSFYSASAETLQARAADANIHGVDLPARSGAGGVDASAQRASVHRSIERRGGDKCAQKIPRLHMKA